MDARTYIKINVTRDNVRIGISEVAHWTQGYIHTPVIQCAGFKDIKSPYAMVEELKAARGCVLTHDRRTVEPPTQPTPPSLPPPAADNYIERNSFYKYILFTADPHASILPPESLIPLLRKFKQDCADNLTNHNQIAKHLGFTRKKSVNVDSIKEDISNEDGDARLSNEIFEYTAFLLKKHLTVITPGESVPQRSDFGNPTHPIILIAKQDIKSEPIEYLDMNTLNAALYEKYKQSFTPLSRQTLPILKDVAKLVGVYKSNLKKDALLTAIESVINSADVVL